ncbi:hypothetical protein M8R20_12655 [Pseudomonas sp. R2.Fl]|nr:hypothetical protein [Pseudomonas sp. R2.Fl]
MLKETLLKTAGCPLLFGMAPVCRTLAGVLFTAISRELAFTGALCATDRTCSPTAVAASCALAASRLNGNRTATGKKDAEMFAMFSDCLSSCASAVLHEITRTEDNIAAYSFFVIFICVTPLLKISRRVANSNENNVF